MTQEEAIKYLRQIYPNGGHSWLDSQRIEAIEMAIMALSNPTLPSNLDEAAEEYSRKKAVKYYGNTFYAFKAGAEWMAGQGFISEGIINQTSGEDTIIELNEHIGYLEDCEEVIVNIRKKQ